jgi:hypothetical protein
MRIMGSHRAYRLYSRLDIRPGRLRPAPASCRSVECLTGPVHCNAARRRHSAESRSATAYHSSRRLPPARVDGHGGRVANFGDVLTVAATVWARPSRNASPAVYPLGGPCPEVGSDARSLAEFGLARTPVDLPRVAGALALTQPSTLLLFTVNVVAQSIVLSPQLPNRRLGIVVRALARSRTRQLCQNRRQVQAGSRNLTS